VPVNYRTRFGSDRPGRRLGFGLCCVVSALVASTAVGQVRPSLDPSPYLDPARYANAMQVPAQQQLTEQFIWTNGDAAALNPAYQATVRGQGDKVAPHYFRVHFALRNLPAQATLYLTGPRSANVVLNGTTVLKFDDQDAGKGFHVQMAEVAKALHPGDNVLAIQDTAHFTPALGQSLTR